MMPVLDGIETLARLKADERLRHIPVVMISAVSDIDRVVRCIELGAEDYLPKPFDKVILRARVGASLERKRLRDAERAHLAEIEAQRRQLDACLRAILPGPGRGRAAARPAGSRRGASRTWPCCSPTSWASPATATATRPRRWWPSSIASPGLCEDLAAAHGLEKINAVGDAVLATANLLRPHAEPALAAARCGLAIHAGARLPGRWGVRVGVHVGPVVAGVVGREKFGFDSEGAPPAWPRGGPGEQERVPRENEFMSAATRAQACRNKAPA